MESDQDEVTQSDEEQEQQEEWRLPTHICINCTRPFAKNLRGTNLLQIDFVSNDGKLRGSRELSVLGVLDTIFRLTKNVGNSNAGMCTQCARVLSHIYTYYANLMELASPEAPVCKIVQQFETHFESNSSQDQEVSYEYDDEQLGNSDQDNYEVEAYFDNGQPDMKPVIGIQTARKRPGKKPKTGRRESKKSKSKASKSTKAKRKSADSSDAEPKRKRVRGLRRSYDEIRRAESERARRARMSETPEARAIRRFKDAERKRLQRRLLKVLKEEELRKEHGEDGGGGNTTISEGDGDSRGLGETLDQRKARLQRAVENNRRLENIRAAIMAEKEQAQTELMTDEPLHEQHSSADLAEDTEASTSAHHAPPELNYDSLLTLSDIGT